MQYFFIAALAGSGKPDDPFTVNFPTFETIAVDYDARTALIRVPDGVLPDGLFTTVVMDAKLAPNGKEVVRYTADTKRVLDAHIQERYAGSFAKWSVDEIAV